MTDHEEFKSNMKTLLTNSQVKSAKITNWHLKGPNPLRFLMGILLTSSNIMNDISKLELNTLNEVKSMIDLVIEDFETDKIDFYMLYEYGACLKKEHILMLKNKLGFINSYIKKSRIIGQ